MFAGLLNSMLMTTIYRHHDEVVYHVDGLGPRTDIFMMHGVRYTITGSVLDADNDTITFFIEPIDYEDAAEGE